MFRATAHPSEVRSFDALAMRRCCDRALSSCLTRTWPLHHAELKIPVSVLRFRPWAPSAKTEVSYLLCRVRDSTCAAEGSCEPGSAPYCHSDAQVLNLG